MTSVNSIGMINFVEGNTLSSMGPWIVSSDSDYTNYTSIQSAIDAALAATPSSTEHHVVYIKAGSYTENLTLHPFVDLVGIAEHTLPLSSGNLSTVKITGNHTISSAAGAIFNASNIQFIHSSSSALFAITQNTFSATLNFSNCFLTQTHVSATTLFSLAYGGSGIFLNLTNCYTASSAKLFTYSGTPVSVSFNINGGRLDIATAQSGSGSPLPYTMTVSNCTVLMNINNTNSEDITLTYNNCIIQTAFTNLSGLATVSYNLCNIQLLTLAGSSFTSDSFILNNCTIGVAGSSSAFSYPSGLPILIQDCVFADTDGISVSNKGNSLYSFSDSNKTFRYTTTSNATPAVIFAIPFPASMSAWVTAKVIGTKTDFSDTTGAEISAIVQDTGSAMTIVNQVRNVGATSSGDVTLVTNHASNTLDVTVTGIASTNIVWTATIEWQKVSIST